MFLYIIVCLIIVLICLYLYYVNKRLNNNVPTVPNALSIIETGLFNIDMKEIFKKLTYIGKWTNDNGCISKFSLGPAVLYVISSPEDLATVLTCCMEKMFVYDLIKPYVGAELVAASVPVWKRNRKILDLAFKPQILDGYLDLFNYQASRLCDVLAQNTDKELDLSHILRRNVLETVSQTIMGTKLDGQDLITDSYADAVEKVMQCMVNRFRYPYLMLDCIFNWSTVKKEQDEALKVIYSLSDQMVKQKKEEILKKMKSAENSKFDEDKPQSCLEIFLEHVVKDDTHTDLQLRNITDNMMLAAFDTTAPTMLFILVCIGSYPEVQKKIYKEIVNVIGKNEREILKDDISKLTYLEAVIKEVIRLYPTGTVVARTTTTDVQLEKVTIPAGCQVVGHIWAVNRNKTYWGSDADDFKPERWLDGSAPSHPAAFASFSPGRRNCIGKSYAMTILKIMLANIVRKFHITADDRKLELEFVILLKPAGGHLMKLERRI